MGTEEGSHGTNVSRTAQHGAHHGRHHPTRPQIWKMSKKTTIAHLCWSYCMCGAATCDLHHIMTSCTHLGGIPSICSICFIRVFSSSVYRCWCWSVDVISDVESLVVLRPNYPIRLNWCVKNNVMHMDRSMLFRVPASNVHYNKHVDSQHYCLQIFLCMMYILDHQNNVSIAFGMSEYLRIDTRC